jgi:hypothetical protein
MHRLYAMYRLWAMRTEGCHARGGCFRRAAAVAVDDVGDAVRPLSGTLPLPVSNSGLPAARALAAASCYSLMLLWLPLLLHLAVLLLSRLLLLFLRQMA